MTVICITDLDCITDFKLYMPTCIDMAYLKPIWHHLYSNYNVNIILHILQLSMTIVYHLAIPCFIDSVFIFFSFSISCWVNFIFICPFYFYVFSMVSSFRCFFFWLPHTSLNYDSLLWNHITLLMYFIRILLQNIYIATLPFFYYCHITITYS